MWLRLCACLCADGLLRVLYEHRSRLLSVLNRPLTSSSVSTRSLVKVLAPVGGKGYNNTPRRACQYPGPRNLRFWPPQEGQGLMYRSLEAASSHFEGQFSICVDSPWRILSRDSAGPMCGALPGHGGLP
jgi:hypothetical protein